MVMVNGKTTVLSWQTRRPKHVPGLHDQHLCSGNPNPQVENGQFSYILGTVLQLPGHAAARALSPGKRNLLPP